MKIMSRNFTRVEKILLVLFSIIIIGLLYYKFIYVTVNESIFASNTEAQSLQTELDTAKARAEEITKMEAELEDIKHQPNVSRMPSYNNSKVETAFLNTVLAGIPDYSITFANVTRNGDQIRRSFTLQFRCKNFKTAQRIMRDINACEYRCQIGDVNCSIADNGECSMAMTATFFETMVGGTPDSALPKDEAATNEDDGVDPLLK